MTDGIKLFQHLLPRGKVWLFTIAKTLRTFFQSLADVIVDPVITYISGSYFNLLPETTTKLTEWEEALGVWRRYAGSTSDRRSDILTVWQDRGGQSKQHLQDILHARGFTSLYVYDWWELPIIEDPVAINPHTYLSTSNIIPENGKGYALVNSVGQSGYLVLPQCGEDLAECGEETALCNYFEEYYFRQKEYILPTSSPQYRYFIYISGAVFGDIEDILENRRDELEHLVYRNRPTNVWVGMLVNYIAQGEQ
jgi:hypothetical protein